MQQIPSDHLEGLYVWSSDDPLPVHTVFAAGSGLPNTDYVIYIQSTYTETCLTGVSDWRLFRVYRECCIVTTECCRQDQLQCEMISFAKLSAEKSYG